MSDDPSSFFIILTFLLHLSTSTSTLNESCLNWDSTVKAFPILNKDLFIPIPKRPTVPFPLGASSGRPNRNAYLFAVSIEKPPQLSLISKYSSFTIRYIFKPE